MVHIITGKEKLKEFNFMAESNLFWMPIIGDKNEKILDINDVINYGIVKVIGSSSQISDSDGRWENTQLEFPENSFVCLSVKLTYKENQQRQDILLYTRKNSSKIKINVPFFTEGSKIMDNVPFFDGDAVVISAEDAKKVGVIIPDKHYFKVDTCNLFEIKTASEDENFDIVLREPLIIDHMLSLYHTPNDDRIIINADMPVRVMDFD